MQQYAIDLRQARFRRAVTGVDPEQLHALLDEAANAYEAAYAELEVLRQKHATLKEELAKVHEAERAVSSVVVKADVIGSSTRARAERQAAEVIARAEERLAEQLSPLRAQCDTLRDEIAALQARRARATGILETAIAELKMSPPPARAPVVGTPPATASAEIAAQAEGTDEYQFDDLDERLSRLPAPAPAPPDADRRLGEPAVAPVTTTPVLDQPRESAPATEVSPAPAAVSAELAESPTSSPLPGPAAVDSRPDEADADPLDPVEPALAPVVASPEAAASGSDAATAAGERNREGFEREPAEVAEPGPKSSRVSPMVWGIGGAAVVFITAAVGVPHLGALASGSTAPSPPPQTRTSAPAPVAPRAAAAAEPAATPGVAAAQAEPAPPLRVRLRALRECWVRITVDGRAVERIIPAGGEVINDATEEVALRVGDAGAIEVEVNGIAQPPLGYDGQVVNRRYLAEN